MINTPVTITVVPAEIRCERGMRYGDAFAHASDDGREVRLTAELALLNVIGEALDEQRGIALVVLATHVIDGKVVGGDVIRVAGE